MPPGHSQRQMSDTAGLDDISGRGSSSKVLTRRQKESLKILMKALTDFVLETKDDYAAESILDYDEEKSEAKPVEKKNREWSQKNKIGRENLLPGRIPRDQPVKQGLASAGCVLIDECVMFEYSLRTLGSAGPVIYGARILRKNLRAFLLVIKGYEIDNLCKRCNASHPPEYHALKINIDELLVCLHNLQEAFERLKCFMLGFASSYYSTSLGVTFHLLTGVLSRQRADLEIYKDKTYSSPAEEQSFRNGLLSFFSKLVNLLKMCSSELSDFQERGIPLIQTSQARESDRYLSLTTVAVFFSAVTSSILQIALQGSSGSKQGQVSSAANLYFFLSLVFSITSAVQALLAMAWKRSFIQVPEHKFVVQWISKSPLFFLINAGVSFSAGLCFFVFTSQTNSFVSLATVILTIFHAVGLLITSFLFIYEQWKFRRDSEDVGKELTVFSASIRLIDLVVKIWRGCFFLPSKWLISQLQKIWHSWRAGTGEEPGTDIEHGGDSIRDPVNKTKSELEAENAGHGPPIPVIIVTSASSSSPSEPSTGSLPENTVPNEESCEGTSGVHKDVHCNTGSRNCELPEDRDSSSYGHEVLSVTVQATVHEDTVKREGSGLGDEAISNSTCIARASEFRPRGNHELSRLMPDTSIVEEPQSSSGSGVATPLTQAAVPHPNFLGIPDWEYSRSRSISVVELEHIVGESMRPPSLDAVP